MDNRTIGLLLRDVSNPSYGQLFSEIHSAAELRGWKLATMAVIAGKNDDAQVDSLSSLVGMGVAGLIVATGDLPSDVLEPFGTHIPIVRAGRPEPKRLIHAVSYDAEAAGRELADLVLGAGHTRIAVVRTRRETSLPEWTRASAMIRTIRSAGLEPFVVDVGNFTGEEYVLPLVQSGAVTVVMCPTDRRQLTYLRVFHENGLRVPEDVSVTGCDGLVLGLELMGLTTYRWPVRHVAQTAVDVIIDLIERHGTPDSRRSLVNVKLPGEIIPGRTLGPPRARRDEKGAARQG